MLEVRGWVGRFCAICGVRQLRDEWLLVMLPAQMPGSQLSPVLEGQIGDHCLLSSPAHGRITAIRTRFPLRRIWCCVRRVLTKTSF